MLIKCKIFIKYVLSCSMTKYGKVEEVKIFYYSPNPRYCAVIAKTIGEVDEIKRAILRHYLREGYKFKEKVRIDGSKEKPAGKVIHITRGNIANLLQVATYSILKIC